MKWFKHETNAYMNLKLQAVINKFGLEGYGYYWACVELVGEQGKNYCVNCEKSWKILFQKLLNIEIKKQDILLDFFSEVGLIDKKALKRGDLFIPKLQERSDEYTKRVERRFGQDTDNVPLEEKRRDKKRIEEIELPNWLNKKAWEAWVKFRKELGKTLKPSTIKFQLRFLEKNIPDHTEIIRNSIMNGWTGLFEIKGKKFNSDYKNRTKEAEEKREREENTKENENLQKLTKQSKELVEKMTIKP